MYNKIMSRIKRFNFNKAFTLAEVLITLGIIGVVAALTIPVLMQNTQKQELKSGLKEATSILTNAYNSLKSDQGLMTNDNCLWNYYLSSADSQFAIDFTSNLKIAKSCGSWGCVSTSGTTQYGKTYTDFQGNSLITNSRIYWGLGTYQYVLQNGMVLFIWSPASVGGPGISIDVNSWKGPNQVGKDVFVFTVTGSNSLVPRNALWENGWGPCNTSNASVSPFGCPSAAFSDDNYWNLW